MSDHAKFAPSGAHRWIPCPGSIRMSENIESKPSEYAMEGSGLHRITETCLREKIPAEQFVGMKMDSTDDPNWGMEFDDEHAQAVQYCVDEVKRISSELGVKGGRLELKVELNEDCWGTVDVLLYNDEWLCVIDFKFGRGKSVGAEGNAQLMIYFLGAARYLHEQGISVPPNAKLVILQPRIPSPTRIWDTTFAEIKTWYEKSVKPAIEMAKNGDAPCNPGEEQCQFCPANGVCTARANFLLGMAEEQFKPYAVKDQENLPEVSDKVVDIREKMDISVDMLTPEIAAQILRYQDDFDNFFKRVGEFALKTALNGDTVPGYKLVYGRSNRKWNKDDESIAKALFDEGLPQSTIWTKKLISPAKAEKALKKDKDKIQDLIVKPLGKTILVDESDSREPVDLTGEKEMEQFASSLHNGETVLENTQDVTVFENTESVDDIMSEFEEDEPEVKEETWKGSNPSPPSKRTKKFQLMEMGKKGGVLIKDAADALFKGNEGQVLKGLRNLNERDGYTIMIHSNNSFTVKE